MSQTDYNTSSRLTQVDTMFQFLRLRHPVKPCIEPALLQASDLQVGGKRPKDREQGKLEWRAG